MSPMRSLTASCTASIIGPEKTWDTEHLMRCSPTPKPSSRELHLEAKSAAYNRFIESEQGILKIVRALDLYAMHVISKLRGRNPPEDAVEAIMSGDKVSILNISDVTLSNDEKDAIKKDGYFREVGEQIIVAAHSAFEHYLVEKFKEYLRFHMKFCATPPREAAVISIAQSMRSLEGIKNAYKETLGIHLPSFDVKFAFNPNSNFSFDSAWEAIVALDKKRHSVVHLGKESPFEIESLMDSWYPFDFTRVWVTHFNHFFDHQIYEGGWFKTEEAEQYFEKSKKNGVCLVHPFIF